MGIMNLFRKKPRYSSLRFCQHAVELPLRFDSPVITVAISRIEETRHFGTSKLLSGYDMPARVNEVALGLLHQPGFDAPLLPVEIEFVTRAPDDESKVAWGRIDRYDYGSEKYYALNIFIFDPDRAIYEALRTAIERAAVSQDRYFHVDFRNVYSGYSNGDAKIPNYRQMAEEHHALLSAIDAGEAELPPLSFDDIAFADAVTLKAPSWSWDWVQGKPGMYHDPRVAAYRKALKWPPLPDDGD